MTTAQDWTDPESIVYCHRCEHLEPGVVRREAVLHGTPAWGALWHCAEHADCPTCPHGSWCDDACERRRSYTGGGA